MKSVLKRNLLSRREAGRLLAWSCVCLLLAWCSVAAGDSGEVDALIDAALQGSGLMEQLEDLPQAIVAAVPEDALAEGSTKADVAAYVKKHVSKQSVQQTVRAALRKDLDREGLDAVLAFYHSPAGKVVGHRLGDALSPNTLRSVRESRKTAAEMSDERLKLIQRVVKAERVWEANARLLHAVIRGMAEGCAVADGASSDAVEGARGTRERLQSFDKAIEHLKSTTEEVALVGFAHALRSLKESELEAVAAYAESNAAKWFRRSVQRGLDETVLTIARTFAQAMMTQRAPKGAKGHQGR